MSGTYLQYMCKHCAKFQRSELKSVGKVGLNNIGNSY